MPSDVFSVTAKGEIQRKVEKCTQRNARIKKGKKKPMKKKMKREKKQKTTSTTPPLLVHLLLLFSVSGCVRGASRLLFRFPSF